MGTETRYYIYAEDYTVRATKSAKANFKDLTGTVMSMNRAVKTGAVLLAGGAVIGAIKKLGDAIQNTARDAKILDTYVGDAARGSIVALAKESRNLEAEWRALRVQGTALLSDVLTPLANLGQRIIAGLQWRKPIEDAAATFDIATARGQQLAATLADIKSEADRVGQAHREMQKQLLAANLASIKDEAEEIGKAYQESVEAARRFNRAIEEQEKLFRRFNPAEAWSIGGSPDASFVDQIKAIKPATDANIAGFRELVRQVSIFVDEFSYGMGFAIAQFVAGNRNAAEAFKMAWKNAIASVVADLTSNLIKRGLLSILSGLGPGGAAIGGLLAAGKGEPSFGGNAGVSKAGAGGSTTYIATVVPPSVSSLLSAGYVMRQAGVQRDRFAVI